MTAFGGALYVGDLSPDVTEANLFEEFNKIGPVASVRVCRDAASRRSLGYAYVNYHQVEHAEKALEVLNGKPIAGRQCRVMWSQRDPALRKSNVGNLFVKNLDQDIDNKKLCDIFSNFGNIMSCKVVSDPNSGKSLGYGYVQYETDEAAQNAIQRVNGKPINSRTVIVQPFQSKKKRGPPEVSPPGLYVASLKKDIIAEEVVKLFPEISLDPKGISLKTPPMTARFKVTTDQGEVVDVHVDADHPSPVLYAFINCPPQENVEKALTVETVHSLFFGGYKVVVDMKHNKKELDIIKLARRLDRQLRNLFISDIPKEWDGNKIKETFAEFGNIQSFLLDDRRDQRKAYVCMDHLSAARRAVEVLSQRGISIVFHRAREPVKIQNLIIAEIGDDWGVSKVADLFAETGRPENILVDYRVKPRKTYVSFGNQHDAQKGIEALRNRDPPIPASIYLGETQKRDPGSNVYVKQLPDAWNDDRLKVEFGKFGTVTSAKVATGEGGKSKGFGFVSFASPQEATEAVAQMNGQQVDEKSFLYVALHQKKDVRRAFLEQQFRQKYASLVPQSNYVYGAPPYGRNFMYPQYLRRMPQMQYYPAMMQPGQMMPPTQGQRFQLLPAGAQRGYPVPQRVSVPPRMPPTDAMRKPRPMQPQMQQRRQPTQAPGRQMYQQISRLQPAEQKQFLGERLFPKIQQYDQERAGKITGMLLEMDNAEIINLLEDEVALRAKIEEALDVLENAER